MVTKGSVSKLSLYVHILSVRIWTIDYDIHTCDFFFTVTEFEPLLIVNKRGTFFFLKYFLFCFLLFFLSFLGLNFSVHFLPKIHFY